MFGHKVIFGTDVFFAKVFWFKKLTPYVNMEVFALDILIIEHCRKES
jgi:hypothetical protein